MSRLYLLSLLLALFILLSPAQAEEEFKTWFIVHSDVPSEVLNSEGQVLGKSGKAIDLRLSSPVPENLSLVLRAEGFEEHPIEISLKAVAESHRLPSRGSYQMKASPSQALPPWLWLLALPVSAVAFYFYRKSREESQASEPFCLGELLGTGASASVYRGSSHLVEAEAIAIKLMAPEYAKNEELRRRYERESQLAITLQHPGIVRVFHAGLSGDSRPYLLMELLEGETLEDSLRECKLFSPEESADILLPLCDALIYLHEQGIVHRDIKPGNIFLSKDGKVKLLDLGIARAEESVDITQTGRTLGSPSYMAPEQIQGEVTPLTDQYALGVVMFELLSGRKPFLEDDVLGQHLREAPPLLSSLNPTVTALQDSVVNRLLEKKAESRFSDMREAREAISSCLSGLGDGTMTC